MTRRICFSVVFACVCLIATGASASTIVVNDVGDGIADDGTCTLREALAAASSNIASGGTPGECAAGEPLPVVDTIAFAIAGPGVRTIQPTSQIPPITESVVIDGYTQQGALPNTLAVGDNAMLLIEIDCSLMPSNVDLFDFHSGGSTVRGLVINRLQGTTMYFSAGSSGSNDNVVEGNFIATDPSGTTFLGSNATAMRVDGARNRIGGTAPASRNVFAATGGSKTGTLMIHGSDNIVQGNYIGVDATGTAPLANSGATNGIEVGLAGAATNTLIGGDSAGAGNVIVNNNISINLHGNGSSGATIQGNHIGVNAAGDATLGGGVLGIAAFVMPNVTIGGSTPGAGNVMAGYNNVISIGESSHQRRHTGQSHRHGRQRHASDSECRKRNPGGGTRHRQHHRRHPPWRRQHDCLHLRGGRHFRRRRSLADPRQLDLRHARTRHLAALTRYADAERCRRCRQRQQRSAELSGDHLGNDQQRHRVDHRHAQQHGVDDIPHRVFRQLSLQPLRLRRRGRPSSAPPT